MTTNELAQESLRPRSVTSERLPAILCVDDDSNVLDAIRRHLRKKFQVHTALGPAGGLDMIREAGPFAVITSDFHMPGMNGIEFFGKARTLAPDSIRIMLTGQTDFTTAIGAVNQGSIFRFLVKPCSPTALERVIDAGLEQHRLLTSERELTERTLLGCVQLLVEILGVVQPEAFSRATRLRRYVKQMGEQLGVYIPWQVEAAAMLSQIGWITLSPETIAKAAVGRGMSGEEEAGFRTHAFAAARMLEKVPRLDKVAKIVENQHATPGTTKIRIHDADPLALGPHLLKAAIDFDTQVQGGLSHEDALSVMRGRAGQYVSEILDAFVEIERNRSETQVRLVPLSQLKPGMILEEELRTEHGVLLLGKGLDIPETFLSRLGNNTYGLSLDRLCRVRLGYAPSHVPQRSVIPD